MDELQLRIETWKVKLIADVIERDIDSSEDPDEVQALTEILTWLRYRIARRGVITPASPTG